MEIEDIGLTAEDIGETWQGIELFDDFTAIANAATNKAILKILNHMNKRDVGGINPEWAISNTFHEALKKLVRKED